MNNEKFTKPGPNEHNKTLYKNGCACVRWREAKRYSEDGYLVYFSPDGNFGSSNKGGVLIAKIGIPDYEDGNGDYERAFAQAKALCDLWRVQPEKMLDGKPVVYDKGCACVVRNDFSGCYEIRVKNWKETEYLNDRIRGFEEDFIHGEKSEEGMLVKAKERCDKFAGRDSGGSINLEYYPDYPIEWLLLGWMAGVLVFLLYWIGFAIKSNALGFSGDEDYVITKALIFLFTGSGLDFFAAHWWQTGLLILVSLLIAMAFWQLWRIKKFSIAYRLFVRGFGGVQAICTAAVWGVVATYWAIVGLWRSIISPIPDALGYPHFIAATIYLAVIVWGVVDFMNYREHRKRLPSNFTTRNTGVAS